ncbi:type 2 lanthipeptide synthetase LanM family protein [Dyella caseinilytica]|uniref:Type 2 lantipeptide synthetase LanM family protein n=1 Tax=Dyella caseinilytica TaxID=1849581 RepID=A0ABX7H1S6_9GAMM|nr:type 2 lanthipeptide synthetase LanM family protein [Dyella caseinilytica]QRN55370.1 type 2 lantipeptide synthetase LanM family protein [Dyella caseinilytica]GGA01229.1 lanthionine synthetase [Dyella caseinilytica]
MASVAFTDNFIESLGCLLAPSLGKLATQLILIPELSSREREVILEETRESLSGVLHAKLTRLLLVELNAARVGERLSGEDSAERWNEFIALASQRSFWEELSEHYPTLLHRVERLIHHRCEASYLFAQRWVADRTKLATLCDGPVGELQALSFGAGDSHRGGLTVALLRCEGGRVVYKPRSVAVDAVLRDFIAVLADEHGADLSIQVPRVINGIDYGWAEFVEHCYAAGEHELSCFYTGIGHLLAIMHVLGASDLHAENLIAHRNTPVVVDCETLFTPKLAMPPSGFGNALDRAAELVSGTVLHIGLLPGRAQALGWRGIDYSGVGSLPGQQPMMSRPAILKAGTDEAYLGTTMMPVPVAKNHPSPEPALATYWPNALEGFDSLTATLRRLDAAGLLSPRLQAFADCRVRVVVRATEVYAEIGRMLWHPVSLHNEAQARQRAHELFAKMAANVVLAPSDPLVIESEIEDLLVGDIPFFSTLVRDGQLHGSRGVNWLPPGNLADAALQHWRASDFAFERNVIRATMVSAYLNDGWTSMGTTLVPQVIRDGDLDQRRRKQAAQIVQGLVSNAIRGNDGSVAWIAPVLNVTGWSVQPLAVDLYGGLSGVALLAAAYVREMHAGRADPVAGIEALSQAIQYTLRLAEVKLAATLHGNIKTRPPTIGAYIGLSAQIWTLLMLAQWNRQRGDELDRAMALADGVLDAAAEDETNDILTGRAGAIPVVLALAKQTGEQRYLDIAVQLGQQLCDLARHDGDRAYWVHPQMWPTGLGGFSHGVTGVGWALTHLARATGETRFEEVAQAAFRFEDAAFDEGEQGWTDLRNLGGPKTASVWCHGAVGIGLAHLDLDPRMEQARTRALLQHAVRATASKGLGWNHCLCHGDLGAWELLHQAVPLGVAPDGMTRESLLAHILSSLEEYGPSCGLTKGVFVPGLMPGLGGVAYQLLRIHPESRLPSVLLLGNS